MGVIPPPNKFKTYYIGTELQYEGASRLITKLLTQCCEAKMVDKDINKTQSP